MAGIIYRDRWPGRGMSEVAVVWRENTQCEDHCESGVSVPDGEIQEFNCCLWFHNQVVSLCLCLCWLSCCEHSQRGAWCKSSGSPEKQVSQLFINCQVLGFRTGMWSVCKGCWEGWMLTCFSNLVGCSGRGIGGFFTNSFTPERSPTNVLHEHIWRLPDAYYKCTFTHTFEFQAGPQYWMLSPSAQMFVQGCESRGGGTMVKDGWLVLFFMYSKIDNWAVGWREGKRESEEEERRSDKKRKKRNAERDRDQRRSGKSLPLLLYLCYISPPWQTNVLVHNGEWLSSDRGCDQCGKSLILSSKYKNTCIACVCERAKKRTWLFTTRWQALPHSLHAVNNSMHSLQCINLKTGTLGNQITCPHLASEAHAG